MASDDVLGRRLLGALLREETFEPLRLKGITSSSIFGDARKGFDWVEDWLKKHEGKWPNAEMLRENTGVETPDKDEPLDYVCDLIHQRTLGKGIHNYITRAVNELEERNPEKALDVLSDCVLTLRRTVSRGEVSSYKKSGESRLGKYRRLHDVKGLLGIPTPWESLNATIQGWVNGCLHVITALANTGKTWFACIIANHAMLLGKKVLFVSLEMSAFRIERRLDALHYCIPFGVLRDAELDSEIEDKIESVMSRDVESPGDILVADKQSVRRVADVTSLVLEHSPDIVIIDGGYRFEGPGGKGNWENTLSIINELQMTSEYTDIPWLVTTQQGDATETGKDKKRGPKMRAWNVRYGKEWIINPDVVIGLYQNEDLRLIKSMEIHDLKMRDADGKSSRGKFRIIWDLERMEFSEIEKGSKLEDDHVVTL